MSGLALSIATGIGQGWQGFGGGKPRRAPPFVVGILGQSQPNHLLDNRAFYRQIPPPQGLAPEGSGLVTVYSDPTGDPVTIDSATVAAGLVNPTLAAWSVVFARELPGREIVLVDLCEGGTGRSQLMDDANSGRAWADLEALVTRVRADVEDFDVIVESWMANDLATAQSMGPEWAPFYMGQRWGGEAFTLGAVNPDSIHYATAPVDHCLWDIEAPAQERGRGLFARARTKWSLVGWPTFNSPSPGEAEMINFSDRSGYPSSADHPARSSLSELFNDPRVQTFAGYDGFSSHIALMTDAAGEANTHPSVTSPDGNILMGWPYAASILRAAGRPIAEPRIVGGTGPEDGSSFEVIVDLPNGGTLTTLRALRGQPTATAAPHQQPVVGFEISRFEAARRPVYRDDQTAYPQGHRGTVEIIDAGSDTPQGRRGRVRITPSVPFGPGDKVEYLRGDAGAILLEPRDTDAQLFLDMLIEHVPQLYDGAATYPMEGLAVRPQPVSLEVPVTAPAYEGRSVLLDGQTWLYGSTFSIEASEDGLLSMWFQNTAAQWEHLDQLIESRVGGTDVFNLRTDSSGRVRLDLGETSFSFYAGPSSAEPFETNRWYHLLASWGAEGAQIYVNGVLAGDYAITPPAMAGQSLTRLSIGNRASLGMPFVGAMGHLWMSVTQSLDISLAENRARFFANGRPVELGADGSAPTGIVPEVYLDGDGAAWNNLGTAGALPVFGALASGPMPGS